MCRFCDSDDVM